MIDVAHNLATGRQFRAPWELYTQKARVEA